MENLNFGDFAIATVIIGALELLIVVLVKTETILKAVERIKGVIRLDYKSRAKRSEDEVRISKRHNQVARERVRTSFVTIRLWNCKWTWNWSDDFTPINIKGYCLGDGAIWQGNFKFPCNHPVNPFYFDRTDDTILDIGIYCSNPDVNNSIFLTSPHNRIRHRFEVMKSNLNGKNSNEIFDAIISKSILSERDLRIANEIKKLKWQFWR